MNSTCTSAREAQPRGGTGDRWKRAQCIGGSSGVWGEAMSMWHRPERWVAVGSATTKRAVSIWAPRRASVAIDGRYRRRGGHCAHVLGCRVALEDAAEQKRRLGTPLALGGRDGAHGGAARPWTVRGLCSTQRLQPRRGASRRPWRPWSRPARTRKSRTTAADAQGKGGSTEEQAARSPGRCQELSGKSGQATSVQRSWGSEDPRRKIHTRRCVYRHVSGNSFVYSN